MKVLMLSIDQNIFKDDSRARSFMIKYASLVDELHIIVYTKRGFKKIEIASNLFIYPTNTRFKLLYFYDGYYIAKKILTKDFLVTSQEAMTGLLAFLLKVRYRIPVQIQVHTNFLSPYFRKESFKNYLRYLAYRFSIARADCIRVVSERIKNILHFTFSIPHSRVTVFPIFVDTKTIQEASIKTNLRQKYPQFDFIILMASRLTREKNISLALDTMREITKEHLKVGLIIVGEGPERESLESRIKNYELGDNVVMEEWSNDLPSYYKTADLFLLTSNYEGYGMTIIEAMSAGCPVVMTDVGLAGEVVANMQNGIVIPVNNKEKLKGAILKLIDNEHLRKTLAQNAQSTVFSFPNESEYLEQYKHLWKNCCASALRKPKS